MDRPYIVRVYERAANHYVLVDTCAEEHEAGARQRAREMATQLARSARATRVLVTVREVRCSDCYGSGKRPVPDRRNRTGTRLVECDCSRDDLYRADWELVAGHWTHLGASSRAQEATP